MIAKEGASVGVIEHLMAAIAGAEIDDLIIELDGPEPPILDGDALSYLALLDRAGTQTADARARSLQDPQTRHRANRAMRAPRSMPAEDFVFDFEIVFPSPAIGTQTFHWPFSPETFRAEIAPARTFGFLHELDALNKAGLGRGASLENTLAIDGEKWSTHP